MIAKIKGKAEIWQGKNEKGRKQEGQHSYFA
jgi:hypothetical protein